MAENSKIEWTDATFNPWLGCTKVAAGCTHCYAENLMDTRYGKVQWGPHGTRVMTSPSNWKQPLKWNREAEKAGSRARVFCASLCDVFEDWIGQPKLANGQHVIVTRTWGKVTGLTGCNLSGGNDAASLDDIRRQLFTLIDATPNLDWLLLTKRPENVRRMWPEVHGEGRYSPAYVSGGEIVGPDYAPEYRRKNVWIGTSIAEQKDADKNIPELLKCRDLSPVLFVSYEPAVGPVHLEPWLTREYEPSEDYVAFSGIDWVIVGGESGAGARPFDVAAARSIVSQCQSANVPCFVKQMGANVVTRNDQIEDAFNNGLSGWPDPEVEHHIHGFREDYQGADCRILLRDKKGGDWSEWPEDLRVRQMPEVSRHV